MNAVNKLAHHENIFFGPVHDFSWNCVFFLFPFFLHMMWTKKIAPRFRVAARIINQLPIISGARGCIFPLSGSFICTAAPAHGLVSPYGVHHRCRLLRPSGATDPLWSVGFRTTCCDIYINIFIFLYIFYKYSHIQIFTYIHTCIYLVIYVFIYL